MMKHPSDRFIVCAYILCVLTTTAMLSVLHVVWLLVLLIPPTNMLAVWLALIITRWSLGG